MRFVTERVPTKQRATSCIGSKELIIYEPAVMLAMALWMFELEADQACIYPDGMQAKYFDIASWLKREGFIKQKDEGQTKHAGIWVRNGKTLEIHFQPGKGDVVAKIKGERYFVEAKGGCINSSYAGILSKLRSNLYEAIGSLLKAPAGMDRLIAAVPCCGETKKLAVAMSERCRKAGLEIALVSPSIASEPRMARMRLILCRRRFA